MSSSCPKRASNRETSLNLVRHGIEETKSTPTAVQGAVPTNNICMVAKGNSCIPVRRVSNAYNVIFALIDTGSSVNLIKESAYHKFYKNTTLLRVRDDTNLRGVNGSAISVLGRIHDQIGFDELPNQWFDIILYVVDDVTMTYDMLLGREFFTESQIKLIYHNGRYSLEYINTSTNDIAKVLPIYAVETSDRFDIV